MSEFLLGFAFGRHFFCIDGLLMDIYVDTQAVENASACVASALQDPYATRRGKLNMFLGMVIYTAILLLMLKANLKLETTILSMPVFSELNL